MADSKKTVKVEFSVRDLMLGGDTTSVFGVPVKLNEDGDKFVGECSAEELKAFKDAGKA